MKKIIIIILSIISIIILHLSTRYTINEIYISKTNDGIYDDSLVNKLFIINYPETYIAYYNKGNSYYLQEKYNEAIDEYEKALKTVKKNRECKVRNNLALSYMKLLNLKSNNLNEEIEFIQKILLENNCASSDLKSGIDDNSQEIYNELEEAKKQVEPNDPNDPNNPNDPKDPNEPTQEEKEIEEKLKEQQRQTQKEREEKEREANYINDFDYYTGKNW